MLRVLDLRRTFLTVIFHTESPWVQVRAGAALHNLQLHFHVQQNVHGRKWADVEERSLFGRLHKQFTPFGPARSRGEKHSLNNLAPCQAAPCTRAASPHIPADPVEQIIGPVVWRLKEAGEIMLRARETLGILLVL